jgi:hypothetical protein
MAACASAQYVSQLKEMWYGRNYADGLIEMDLGVRHAPSESNYLPESGYHLMELWLDEYHHYGTEFDDEHHDYIEKNLYDFYDIQLYANIFVGSNF